MEYRNPRKNENGTIDCEINHPTYGWIPFTCYSFDIGAEFDTQQLYNIMNNDPNLIPYIAPPEPTEQEIYNKLAVEARQKRNSLLITQVDPIVSNPLRWAELSETTQQQYIQYRRDLLDITLQEGFPYNIVWPTKPN
jgi:hypothetical protein